MATLRVTNLRGRTSNVAPDLPDGVNVTGVGTVGIVTISTSVVVGSAVTVNDQGVIAAGIITGRQFSGDIVGVAATFSGDVSVGGTLTYEDVERVDATGLSTFREGLNVGNPATGIGGTFNPQGDISAGIGTFAGAVTANSFSGDGSGLTGVSSWDSYDSWLYN